VARSPGGPQTKTGKGIRKSSSYLNENEIKMKSKLFVI
jgi:hypothetical protein